MQSAPRVVIPPPPRSFRKYCAQSKKQHHKIANKSRSPAGPRRLGTATRISASLSRRLSAFFGSTHDQAPKAAKFAVLNPGHAGFPKRVERSEGSDTTPVRNTPVSACEPLCAILLRKPSVYPLSPVKANMGRLCERRRSPYDRCIGSVDMTAFPALFTAFSRTKKKAG